MLIRELSSEIIEKYYGFYEKYNFSLCHLEFKELIEPMASKILFDIYETIKN